ncbi:hypothetical protein JCM15765_28480 [Paradesulfitobacterium aromaticivorans]
MGVVLYVDDTHFTFKFSCALRSETVRSKNNYLLNSLGGPVHQAFAGRVITHRNRRNRHLRQSPFRPAAELYIHPSEPTLRRHLQSIDAEKLDEIMNQWLAEQTDPDAIAIDGKTLKGAKDVSGRQLHLMAAILHKEGVVGQGPRVMASLRNLVISLFRLHEVKNTAKALRTCGRNMEASLSY